MSERLMKMAEKSRGMTDHEMRALAAAKLRQDDQIDLTDPDAPEVKDWSKARRGTLFRPVKQPVTIRLDSDLVAWFKDQGDSYQTRINAALREYVERHR